MFVKKTQRKYKNKTYVHYKLVESIRTPKGPRHEVVCSLGDLSPRPRKEWLKLVHKVGDALVGQGDFWEDENDPEVMEIVRRVKEHRREEPNGDQRRETPLAPREHTDEIVMVRTHGVRTERHREAGSVHAGVQFWQKLGMDSILRDVGLSRRSRVLTCAMVMNRLIQPKSEHAMPDWLRSTGLGDILGEDFAPLAEDSLYRNMDRLYWKRESIESMLAEKEKDLFNLDQTIYLYDITSTYFEGLALGNPKAKRGYSRDKRFDCPQVLVGLALNGDGFPLCHEVFEGNLQDRRTLGRMLDLLDERVGLKKGGTVVVDRGMSNEENLKEITSRGMGYIVAARQSERDLWLGEFEDEEGFEEVVRVNSPLNEYKKKSEVQVKKKQNGAQIHVLCVSEGRKAKDRAIREKQEKKLLEDLRKLEIRIQKGRLKRESKIGEAIGRLKERYPRVSRYYKMDYDAKEKKFIAQQDEKKLSKAERLDGSYLLKTNVEDVDGEEIWRIYTMLTRVEDAFRDMKSPLSERPIFHQIERRVDTHIFLCVLAYHLMSAIEKTLLDKGEHTSWGTVRERLKTHQISTVALPTSDGSELRIRRDSTPEPEHKRIYDLLEIPHEIIPPQKTWTK